MNESRHKRIVDQEGLEGSVEIDLYTKRDTVLARFEDGKWVSLPMQMLVTRKDGSYYLPLSVAALPEAEGTNEVDDNVRVVPVIEETLNVEKQSVPLGAVKVSKTTYQEQVTVDEPIIDEQVEVEHVAVNQYVDSPVDVRYEGDKIIVPLFEEVLVVQKRLLLREELHITKRRVERHEPQEYTLRREEVNIERVSQDSEVS
jgi:uncharacterized protein (TIGR02271 family)